MAERRLQLAQGDWFLVEQPGDRYQLLHGQQTVLVCSRFEVGALAWMFDRMHAALEDSRLQPPEEPHPR